MYQACDGESQYTIILLLIWSWLSARIQCLYAGSGLLRQQVLHVWLVCYKRHHKRWNRNTPGFWWLVYAFCNIIPSLGYKSIKQKDLHPPNYMLRWYFQPANKYAKFSECKLRKKHVLNQIPVGPEHLFICSVYLYHSYFIELYYQNSVHLKNNARYCFYSVASMLLSVGFLMLLIKLVVDTRQFS